jgi:hypothetical protein
MSDPLPFKRPKYLPLIHANGLDGKPGEEDALKKCKQPKERTFLI